jgi:cytidine deaminase
MKQLSAAATSVMAKAYAPYSNYSVGTAIRTVSGEVYVGCNVENAAYPLGNCAESSAIAAMVAGGETRIAEVFIMTKGDKPGTPCGGCRQRLAEFGGADIRVYCGLPTGEVTTYTLGDLLPHAFDLEENKT